MGMGVDGGSARLSAPSGLWIGGEPSASGLSSRALRPLLHGPFPHPFGRESEAVASIGNLCLDDLTSFWSLPL